MEPRENSDNICLKIKKMKVYTFAYDYRMILIFAVFLGLLVSAICSILAVPVQQCSVLQVLSWCQATVGFIAILNCVFDLYYYLKYKSDHWSINDNVIFGLGAVAELFIIFLATVFIGFDDGKCKDNDYTLYFYWCVMIVIFVGCFALLLFLIVIMLIQNCFEKVQYEKMAHMTAPLSNIDERRPPV